MCSARMWRRTGAAIALGFAMLGLVAATAAAVPLPSLRLSSAPPDLAGMIGADVNDDGFDDLVMSAGERDLLVRLGHSQGLMGRR
jgi:hypothetical protein